MAKITNKPRQQANLSFTSFDMSKDLVFSTPFAQIVPCYFDILNPGEKVDFSTDMFTRTEPLVKPALIRISEKVDWFFIPMQQLYSVFGDVFDGVQDIKSSLITPSRVGSTMPFVRYRTLFETIFDYDEDEHGRKRIKLTDDAKEGDQKGQPIYHDALRILQMLGYSSEFLEPRIYNGHEDPDDESSPELYDGWPEKFTRYTYNPLPLCAYQKIFMDYYRLDDWEANDPNSYNLDKYYASSELDETAYRDILDMLKLHYIPWKKDYYSNVQPSPLFGADSVNGLGNGLNLSSNVNINNWQQGNLTGYLSILGLDDQVLDYNSEYPTTVGFTNVDNTGGIKTHITTSNIRGMFAFEKLLEVTRRAGKHYDKQVLAHFGYQVPKGISGEVYYLGSDSNEIDLNEVISLANTSSSDGGSALGSMAGKGVGFSKGNKKSFRAPCHGILMAVTYSKAPALYRMDDRVDKLNTIFSSVDYYHPELDHLTMQPLFGYENSFFPFGSDWAGEDVDSFNSSLVAWQYQFSHLKMKYDQVAGKALYGDDQTWVPTKPFGFYTSPSSRYYVSPEYLDNLFEVKFGGQSPDLSKQAGYWSRRDPFIHFFRFRVYKSSTMSTYSLPRLVD